MLKHTAFGVGTRSSKHTFLLHIFSVIYVFEDEQMDASLAHILCM